MITFVADFFHLAPLEAAKKLAEDFQIPIFTDSSKKRNASKKKEKPKRTLYQTEKKFEEWERESIHILSDYLHLLEEWKVNHAPKMPDEEWKAEFIEACQQTERINYYLDLLVFGELQDRIELLLDSGKDVKRIEERMEEYRRNNKWKMEEALDQREMNSKLYSQEWFEDGQIDEVVFCENFLQRMPLK